MSEFKVVPVDASDESAFRTYYETFKAGTEAGRTDPATWTYEAARVSASKPTSARQVEVYIAYHGETPIGAGDIVLSLLENQDVLEFDFAVREESRERGAGSAMFAYISEKARATGRTSLMTEINGPKGGTEAAESFMSKRGLTLGNTEFRRQLRIPVPEAKLDSLAAKAAERAAGYRLVSWADRTPDEYAEQYAYLKGLLIAEAPTGDLDIEPEKWDVARLRESEEVWKAKGYTMYTTVAVAPDGTLAGHTQLMLNQPGGSRAYQNDTLVLSSHRGHRLGLALKIASLRVLASKAPQVTSVDTWNAEQNGPMVAINDELGFQIIEVCQEWQGKVNE